LPPRSVTREKKCGKIAPVSISKLQTPKIHKIKENYQAPIFLFHIPVKDLVLFLIPVKRSKYKRKDKRLKKGAPGINKRSPGDDSEKPTFSSPINKISLAAATLQTTKIAQNKNKEQDSEAT